MDKVVSNAATAVDGIVDGSSLSVGGFGLCGVPSVLIAELHRIGVTDLEAVSNNCGVDEWGLGILLKDKRIRRMVASYVGENKEFERQFLSGELEVELNQQGTFAERIRAGGSGIGGFYPAAGVGTKIAEGKETRVIDGREYLLEKPLTADFALVRAWRSDRWGNLLFHETARNFAPMMCMAAKVTIVECEHLVEVGELDPDAIHIPSIFVKRI